MLVLWDIERFKTNLTPRTTIFGTFRIFIKSFQIFIRVVQQSGYFLWSFLCNVGIFNVKESIRSIYRTTIFVYFFSSLTCQLPCHLNKSCNTV